MGYKSNSYTIKRRKVWNGFVTGTIFSVVTGFFIYSINNGTKSK